MAEDSALPKGGAPEQGGQLIANSASDSEPATIPAHPKRYILLLMAGVPKNGGAVADRWQERGASSARARRRSAESLSSFAQAVVRVHRAPRRTHKSLGSKILAGGNSRHSCASQARSEKPKPPTINGPPLGSLLRPGINGGEARGRAPRHPGIVRRPMLETLQPRLPLR